MCVLQSSVDGVEGALAADLGAVVGGGLGTDGPSLSSTIPRKAAAALSSSGRAWGGLGAGFGLLVRDLLLRELVLFWLRLARSKRNSASFSWVLLSEILGISGMPSSGSCLGGRGFMRPW